MRITFYYDIVCPFAYLASKQIENVCAGAELRWQPILLGGLLKSIGNPEPMRSAPPAKAHMNLVDAQRWAEYRGVPLVFPTGHPRRTVEAMRLCTAMTERRPQVTHALYRAYWVDGDDVSDPKVLERIAGQRVDLNAAKDALRSATDAAASQGVFGVPSMHVETDDGPSYLFWGQDRLELVEKVISGWRPKV